MLNRRIANFHEAVWTAAGRVGASAPRVTDEIMKALFPRTIAEAEIEGADKMLREGIITAVKGVLRGASDPDTQRDFSEIDERFQPLTKELKSKTYFVEEAGEYVSVPRLIAEPDLLDDARRFMRRKGLECFAEADRLDRLYEEVTAAPRFV